MRIDSSLPMHIARAYGVQPKRPLAGPAAVGPTQPVKQVRAADAYQPAANSSPVGRLVAGKVSQAVDFDTSTLPRPNTSEPFQLYTRAADKIEAAVAVQVGRALDVTG